MFNSLSDRITGSLRNLRKQGRLSEQDVEAVISDIRRALLDADVALLVVRAFTAAVREKAVGAVASQALNPAQQVVKIVNDELISVLGGEARDINWAADGEPTVIMLAGLQGAGKTTLAGKLGRWLRENGKRPLLVASDLQRPNAVQQLTVVAGQAGVDVWAPEPGNGIGDPVQVAKSGVEHARSAGFDVVVVDTAGRLGIDEELMEQARNIRNAVNPHEVLFVLDAMIGQDAVNTSLAFRDGVGFTGVVLSKLDGDARGGAALSVRGVTGQPVLFASTGEKLDAFERFHADRMASRILDMGDILTLIEQAERTWNEEEAADLAAKMAGGDFTLDDFLAQLNQMRKMGSMKKLMGMLPGMGQFREAIDNFDEREIDRQEAIVLSMTKKERANPKILNGSRRLRIAKGSGTSVQEVNSLMDRFEQAKKMMTSMARGGGVPGMPQIPGMPGKGGGYTKKQNKKAKKKSGSKKGRSGNPAKRRQQELEASKKSAGSSFGAGQAKPDVNMDDLAKFLR
ncbi:signal recognition particle protein [Arcanobacterium haemolyticum]|uniref:Signal recognition particle protein n=1 Tax=Arcanobacterium haemolyticum (strain ATCC 9345 / DSM 20595 / CCM 5947 / CCUG 17215 / LMG 16163 / NBRC 15585 / NCTC 8452 / 11018) TaxID=644284 RepID=D7BN02_ARCHD|nr:signal recognition particle protein [Arcanobacterium haemolyticum]ADH92301.1 signal recognition particle protein [Arcanobacterium haemolyticum DSM 20595]SQH28978.1 Fifty-four homolog [Arcanobacterium haemolyticum]